MANIFSELKSNEIALVTGGQQSTDEMKNIPPESFAPKNQKDTTQQSKDPYQSLKIFFTTITIIGIYSLIGMYT